MKEYDIVAETHYPYTEFIYLLVVDIDNGAIREFTRNVKKRLNCLNNLQHFNHLKRMKYFFVPILTAAYKRSSGDRHKLIIDTPAAETVRQIFNWAADGVSIYEVVKRLNASKIPSPETYISELNVSNESHPTDSGLWHPRTVKNILENEVYLGRLVQGKTKRINFVRQPTPANEWICCNESHEAIISEELFQVVQTLRNTSRNFSRNGSKIVYSANIFKSKIYCAHCGGYLERKKNHDRYIYHCVTNRLAPNSCVGNRIGESDVNHAVLEQLLQYKDWISDEINTPSIEADIISELRFIEMELSSVQDITRGLYENFVNSVLDESEYRELKSNYQVKIDTFKQRADELKEKLNDEKRKKTILRESLRVLNELVETKMLTKEYIDRFVERIEVFQDGLVHIEL